jgi:hypothetical protein
MTISISWSTLEESTDGETLSTSSVEHTPRFDAVITETHATGTTPTEHAVESGAPLSDHKRQNQRRITLEAVVTNTPIGRPPESGFDSSPIDFDTTRSEAAGAVVRVYTGTFDRMVAVFDTLDWLATQPIACTVTTRIRTYDAVQIVNVSGMRDPESGDSLKFTIEMVEVRIADSLRVDVPRPREPRGQARGESGTQATDDEPALQSVASRSADALREAIGL